MQKISFQIVQGRFDDERQMHAWHIVMTQHTLLTDRPRADGRGFEITDEKAIETFTRYCDEREGAIQDALRRKGELMKALPVEA